MELQTLTLPLFLFFIAAIAGALLYNPRKNILLYLLRVLAVFMLLLFLWNPSFSKIITEETKPKLILLQDISPSMKEYENQADSIYKILADNPQLKQKFEIKKFYFADSLYLDKPSETHLTNISRALKTAVEQTPGEVQKTIVLITDGNQTDGNSYLFTAENLLKTKIIPIITGDTSRYENIKIQRIDYNKTVAKDNYFFIKSIITAENLKGPLKTKWQLFHGSQKIAEKTIKLTPDKNFTEINYKNLAIRPGIQTYTIRVIPFPGEKIKEDNKAKIRLEVVEKKAEILILAGKIHPDAGLIKRILTENKSYRIHIDRKIPSNKTFDLIICIQPQKEQLEKLVKRNESKWWITGIFTDWEAINNYPLPFKRKLSGNLTENYFPVFNDQFDLFDISPVPSDFPPLKDIFGKIRLVQPAQILYYSRIKKINTREPMAVIFPGQRQAAVFGQGLWLWNMYALNNGENKPVKEFINRTVAYLISQSSAEQLKINFKPVYIQNEQIKIRIEAYNTLLQPNPKAKIQAFLKDSFNHQKKIPVYYKEPYFIADAGFLNPGTYQMRILYKDFNLSKKINFQIKPFNREKNQPADIQSLQTLSGLSGEQVYTPSTVNSLITKLIQDTSSKIILKERIKQVRLRNRFVWLLLFILFLTIEWFFRKYKGML